MTDPKQIRAAMVDRLEEIRREAIRLEQPHVALAVDDRIMRLAGMPIEGSRAAADAWDGVRVVHPNGAGMDDDAPYGRGVDGRLWSKYEFARRAAWMINEALNKGTKLHPLLAKVAIESSFARLAPGESLEGEVDEVAVISPEPADAA